MDRSALTLDRMLAAAVEDRPEHPFLIWQGESISYREFDELSNRAARAWQRLGVRAGDKVVFMLDNCPEFLVGWFGLAKIGATLVAVNTRFQTAEALYVVQDCEARVVLTDARCREVVRSVAEQYEGIDTVLMAGSPPSDDDLLFDLCRREDPAPLDLTGRHGEEVASLIYTSGSTGRPKGVVQPHANFVLTGQACAEWFRMGPDERVYVCLPLYHINAQAYSTMSVLAVRGTIVLAPRFSARQFWADVRGHQVTMFNFIGAMMSILSQGEPSPEDADNAVRVAYSGSVGSLTLERRQMLEERYGLRLMTGFGMSETTFGFIEPYDEPPRVGSIGLPRHHPDPTVPRTEARVLRPDGRQAGPGEEGELLLRNGAMMQGYHNDPERTAEALRDGWLYTGDLVRFDEDGYFYFVDRKKDIIRTRGENVAPLEVERVLNAHPAVEHAAVVGVPSEHTEEDILAFVVPAAGQPLSAEEVWAWVEERLAAFKVPRYVQFLDQLPRTGSQKISKPDLRALAAADATGRRDRRATSAE